MVSMLRLRMTMVYLDDDDTALIKSLQAVRLGEDVDDNDDDDDDNDDDDGHGHDDKGEDVDQTRGHPGLPEGPTRKPKLGSVNFSNLCSVSVANWKAKDLSTFVFGPNRLAPV